MRDEKELEDITLLGSKKTEYKTTYDPTLLEKFKNRYPRVDYLVTLQCPEFTSLCPKTGQPDFAKIIINYVPEKSLVESKSLKLYLFSFRANGDFHEDCVNMIMRDLIALLAPQYIEVIGIFNPRGGISIRPFANYCKGDKFAKMAERRREAFANEQI